MCISLFPVKGWDEGLLMVCVFVVAIRRRRVRRWCSRCEIRGEMGMVVGV
jgi:hypothetical protein